MKKNKKLISIILTSFMIFSIVATSLVPTISSHAEDGLEDIIQDYGITTNNILVEEDSDLDIDCFAESYSDEYNSAVAVINHGMPVYDFLRPYYLSTTDFPKYFMWFYDTGLLAIMQLPEDSFVTVYPDEVKVYSNQSDFHVFDGYIHYFSFSSTGLAQDRSVSASDFLNNTYTHDGSNYGICNGLPATRPSRYVIATNCPIYETSSSSDSLDYVNFGKDYNYISGGNKNANITNNLSLYDGTKFYLSNSSFNTGSLYLYPVFNKSQISEDKNFAYYLRLVGTATYTCTYNSLSTSDSSFSAITNYFPMSTTGNNPYDFNLKNGNEFSYDIPVSEVLNGSWSMDLSTLNGYFYNNQTENNLSVLASAFDNTFSGYSVFDTTDSVLAGLGFKYRTAQLDLSKIKISEFNIIPTSARYHIDLYVVKKSLTSDEVFIGDVQSFVDCDFVTGSVSSDNVNTSSYDDVKNALGTSSIPSSYAPVETSTNYGGTSSSVGGGSSSSDNNSNISGGNSNSNIGEGAVVINNNPTFNNDVSSSSSSESKTSGFGGFLSTLITLIANGKTSSVDTISSISGSTGYSELVSSYIGTIPSSLWSTIIVTFTACLGISIIAFIISLLFKIFF